MSITMQDGTTVECISLSTILRTLNKDVADRHACENEMLDLLRVCGEDVVHTPSYRLRRTLVSELTIRIRRRLAMVGA